MIRNFSFVTNKDFFCLISVQTSEQFLQSYDKPTKNRTNLFVPFAFDSVWVLALTLNNSINKVRTKLNRSLEDFNYRDSDMVQSFRETLEKLEFQGITVSIKGSFLKI